MATARRFAATPEDAEDAYQRGVEILLTKAPTTAEEELLPWLRTVVKHEAWALRRQRQRAAPVADDGEVPEPSSEAALTHEQAERLERLRLGAEAMRGLKPQEIRALLLRAEGYSYRQIQEITGWTYTKVNRCLTEGRRAFLDRVAGIETGSECDRLAPLLSKLVDGEAKAEDLSALRPHLRTCLACRATLREFRRAPATAAALVPAAVLVSDRPFSELPARLVESLTGWAQKAHTAVEMASAQKVAAVAASTAVIAGGGAATVKQVTERPQPKPRAAQAERAKPASAPVTPAPVEPQPLAPVTRPTPAPDPRAIRAARERQRQQREKARERAVKRRTPPAHQEFEPAWASGSPPSAPEPTASAAAEPAPAPAPKPQPYGGGAEEFAP